MKIEIKVLGVNTELPGGSIVYELTDGFTLGQLFRRLAEEYGKAFQGIMGPESGMLVLYNGDVVWDADKELEDGAKIVLAPAFAGG